MIHITLQRISESFNWTDSNDSVWQMTRSWDREYWCWWCVVVCALWVGGGRWEGHTLYPLSITTIVHTCKIVDVDNLRDALWQRIRYVHTYDGLYIQVSSLCTMKSPVGVSNTGCYGNHVYQWAVQLAVCHVTRHAHFQSPSLKMNIFLLQVSVCVTIALADDHIRGLINSK